MFYSLVAFIIMAVGGILMIFTSIKYHKLLNYYKQESYQALHASWVISVIFFYLFILGYILSILYVLLNEVTYFFTITAVIFLIVTVSISLSVKNQATQAVSMRNKTLEAIRAFVDTIDLKDFPAPGHSRQVHNIISIFYDYLINYKQVLNKARLLDAAILHDIGKINIPAELYNKQGQLTDEEWSLVKTHPRVGKEMLDNTFFKEISEWVEFHHERVDGNGYYGIASENIPLESKIISIADSYSALCSDRPYRPKMSHEEAAEIIRRSAGKQFDRQLVDCFVQIDKDVLEEAMSLKEEGEHRK
jgi:HD-GYP domain-containing protein (c-di-GMP phosphodiesterase class II)